MVLVLDRPRLRPVVAAGCDPAPGCQPPPPSLPPGPRSSSSSPLPAAVAAARRRDGPTGVRNAGSPRAACACCDALAL